MKYLIQYMNYIQNITCACMHEIYIVANILLAKEQSMVVFSTKPSHLYTTVMTGGVVPLKEVPLKGLMAALPTIPPIGLGSDIRV